MDSVASEWNGEGLKTGLTFSLYRLVIPRNKIQLLLILCNQMQQFTNISFATFLFFLFVLKHLIHISVALIKISVINNIVVVF